MKIIRIVLCGVMLFHCASCNDFLDLNVPKNQIISHVVFENEDTALSAMRGIYTEMVNDQGGISNGGALSLSMIGGLSADEFVDYSNDADRSSYYRNELVANNGINKNYFWERAYKYIYYSNSIIDGLKSSTDLRSDFRNELMAEAKFLRAFWYFYLVNLYGDVPLSTSTDYRVNNSLSRSPRQDVYRFIIDDLKVAKDFLPEDFSAFSGERIRATKWAAIAMLARVYLYTKDWNSAELYSDSVINRVDLFLLADSLDDVFLKNGSESVWQLMPVNYGVNTWEGNSFIIESGTTNPQYVALSEALINAFEKGDKRFGKWVNHTDGDTEFYYPFKYKVKQDVIVSEYSTVLRIAEQYLIRSEARARLGRLEESIADIDRIRARAGLSLYSDEQNSYGVDQVLGFIEKERRVEMFSEWGHRWLDLKRWGKVLSVLEAVEGKRVEPMDTLYPIPLSERYNNLNLSQNYGY